MRRSRSVLFAAALLAGSTLVASEGKATTDSACYVPSFLLEPGWPLARTMEAAKNEKRLSILVVSGSPSQTTGAKGLRSYPVYLENELRERLPGVGVSVVVRATVRQSAGETLPLLTKMLEETRPSLVVWQVGTVDTFRRTSPERFGEELRRGLGAIGEFGADALLLDMQFSPRTDRLVDYGSYLDEIRVASERGKVPLFHRYEIMRYWNVSGAFDLGSLRNDGLYERIHICLGEQLADFILRAADLRENKGFGG